MKLIGRAEWATEERVTFQKKFKRLNALRGRPA